MKRIQAIIIDDEPLAHKVILKYAEEIPFLEIIGQAYLATDAYDLLTHSPIDLIFLDVDMPILKGLDFLKTLQRRPAVIVTSAHQEYALEGFELQVSDYLLKPFRFERFLQAVNRVIAQRPTESATPQDKMFIKVDKKQVQIDLSQVQYFESYGNYVKVWLDDNFLLTPRTLSSFSSTLDERFQQIHKSYIVQKSYIKFVEGNVVMMANGKEVNIGKSYRTLVRNLLKGE